MPPAKPPDEASSLLTDMPPAKSGPDRCRWFLTLWGIVPPRGERDAMLEQWRGLSVVSALLVMPAAAGLYSTESYVFAYADFKQDLHADKEGPIHRTMARVTLMLFCMTAFCFINTAVTCVFFTAMAAREKSMDVMGAYARLGGLYHCPHVFFRVGFVLLVLALSCYFTMVTSLWETLGCLAFCMTVFIAPMLYIMASTLSAV